MLETLRMADVVSMSVSDLHTHIAQYYIMASFKGDYVTWAA